MGVAGERFAARDFRRVRGGQRTGREDAVPGGQDVAAVGAHLPPERLLVQFRGGHPGSEQETVTQVEPVRDVIDVCQDLGWVAYFSLQSHSCSSSRENEYE